MKKKCTYIHRSTVRDTATASANNCGLKTQIIFYHRHRFFIVSKRRVLTKPYLFFQCVTRNTEGDLQRPMVSYPADKTFILRVNPVADLYFQIREW